ncbi:ATP dependent DNA ligase [Rhizobium mongolense]
MAWLLSVDLKPLADGARQIGVAVRTAEVDEGDDGVERCTQRFAVDQSIAVGQGVMVAKAADGAHQVAVDERQAIVWVKPTPVAEVEYRAWTHDGKLRQSSYKGLREADENAEIYEVD